MLKSRRDRVLLALAGLEHGRIHGVPVWKRGAGAHARKSPKRMGGDAQTRFIISTNATRVPSMGRGLRPAMITSRSARTGGQTAAPHGLRKILPTRAVRGV